MVPVGSRRIPRAPRYSGYHYQIIPYLYGSFTLYGLPFQARSSSDFHQIAWSYNPRRRRNDSGLGYSAFARHYLRNHILFSLPTGTKMFQFPGFAHRSNSGVAGSLPPGFPIRTSAGRRAFAPHRGFSQLVTSFVASESHRHPPCALFFFPCILQTGRGSNCRPRAFWTISSFSLDLFLNSISRFDSPPARATPARRGGGSLFSSRSQHVNDLNSGG